ncbi:MAG: hypothetical protein SF097_18245 [Acidobacteriota bacterium]|nr:hypothetical protein [Acidobacteriota bacterium]
MDAAVLTMIDTAGIQRYVFGSNRLRENLGASYLVELATKAWVFQALDKLGAHNMTSVPEGSDDLAHLNRKPDPNLKMEDGKLSAELLYAGGGNALVLFASKTAAQRFAQILSQRVLCDAPGLELVIAHSVPFRWDAAGNDLRNQEKDLRKERLAQKKHMRQATPTLQLGLGVTVECEATGLVATLRSDRLEPEPRLIGRETKVKLQQSKRSKAAESNAKRRLVDVLKDLDPRFDFPDELDQLGHKGGEESYIAVVHLDGNDMGQVRKGFLADAKDNREYIKRLRKFSAGVEEASNAALISTFKQLEPLLHKKTNPNQAGEEVWYIAEPKPNFIKRPPNAAPKESEKDHDLEPSAAPKEIEFAQIEPDEDDEGSATNTRKAYWPFRPIVFGGDDITFVCNGQLGLSLAAAFAQEFAAQTQKELGVTIHSGGGVCIVKTHYPFRRAYDLSESLTKEAKRELGDQKQKASALDWHISSTGLSGSLNVIRQREYQVQAGSLLMRPLWLNGTSDWRTWQNFNWLVAVFNFHKQFASRRNKLKALREALRSGPEAVKEFLRTYELSQEKIIAALWLQGWDSAQKGKDRFTGWQGERCGYFDAIEAMDHHFLLQGVRDERD